MAITQNEGGRLLKQLGRAQHEIGDAVSVTGATVSYWISGKYKPVKAMREILWTKYRIPPEAWDRDVQAEPAPVEPTEAQAPFDVDDQLRALETSYYRLIGGADTAGEPLHRAKLLNASAGVLSQIAKIRGDDHTIGKRFLKSPEWRRIREAIQRGCNGYPEAAAAIARELRSLDDEAS